MRRMRRCVCVSVCLEGKCAIESGGKGASQREIQRESVCLDQLHSKSVYSAQFGIKHNRLLSACYCLWCPIKMEFIAALRESPNYTFSPHRSILAPVSLALSFALAVVMVWGLFFSPHSSSSCQASHQNSSLQTQLDRYNRHAHLPVSHCCHLHLSECCSDFKLRKACVVGQ